MNDAAKTKPQLLKELLTLRQRLAALETWQGEHKRAELQSPQIAVQSGAERDDGSDEALRKRLAEVAPSETEPSRAYQDRQQFLEHILKISPHIIYVYDVCRRQMVYVSRQVSTLLGYSVEKTVQQNPRELRLLFHPEDWPHLKERNRQLATDRDDLLFPVEYRIRHRNGEWRWFLDRGRVFARNADGAPLLSFGIVEDISERKYAETTLQVAEEEYRAIFEHSNVGIYRSSLDGKQLRANPALVKLNGYASEEEMLPAV